ncbi:LacI family DNA-binding transcriptional regulator [Bordetella bronchialis]|uniref:LacI family transcriptional regulator n=1 Tax=Bordetella bronchialis TaxID=463025 RepID=A0A193FCK8_9BORD|nr:LacI family DNA-binding transcriptional regulator [Bordetella bronchialis]ANN65008.1 LacI family transcriptional regulator [Bordetella bronchialis]ANN70039.1 LacI family transcriptional regulator [Bordetella bronchialis]
MASKPLHRPSILDIARDAGVSPATVSRAFNRPELLRADTLQRIETVAREHGFRPNRVGSSLRSGNTRTLGMALPTLCNPVFAECFEGAEAWAHANGYSIMVTTTGYDVEREAAAVRSLLDHQVEGLLLTVGNAARSATLRDLAREGLPYVLVYNESPSHPSVSVDNMAAAGDMVRWLAGQGHARIALVTGPLSASDRARRRLQGARACARELGLPEPLHLPMPLHTAANADVLRQALRRRPAPTALFCSNDLLAASVISALRGLGMRVPEDVSVCGFDGMHFAALMVPPLTTVEQPSRDIGAQACAQLLARLRGDAAGSPRLPHRLITGRTVAAASSRPSEQGMPKCRNC